MKSSRTPLSLEFTQRIDAARRGSRPAREELFQRYYPQVERMVHSRLRRELGGRRAILAARFSSADVVQDVFQALLTGLSDFHGTTEGEFVAYVAKTIQHRVLDTIRHHRASCRDYLRSTTSLDRALSADDVPTAREGGCSGYGEALVALPPESRALLLARFERSLSFEELAREFGYPSRYSARRACFAAQSRLIARLRSELETDRLEPPTPGPSPRPSAYRSTGLPRDVRRSSPGE